MAQSQSLSVSVLHSQEDVEIDNIWGQLFVAGTTQKDRSLIRPAVNGFVSTGYCWIYIILHMDIYHGKKAFNIDIAPEPQCLPTTMKAVINTVCQLDMANDPSGSRIFALDNR